MKYIANIVTKSNSYKFNDFINICRDKSEIIVGLPTLIVGIENAKEISGNNLNFIERQIDKNTFWTFNVVEKRSDNERDVENFKKSLIKTLKSNIKYNFFNVLTCSRGKFKKFINFLRKDTNKCFFFTDKMLYIGYDNNIIGISLLDCEYIGVNMGKIYKKICSLTQNVMIEDRFLTLDERMFFNNDSILLAAMFCYARS